MAELEDRLPTNVEGRFYVDASCIDCDICRQIAPEIFVRDDEAGQTFVSRQPQNAEEQVLAEDAVEDCPTQSIGCDGAETIQSH